MIWGAVTNRALFATQFFYQQDTIPGDGVGDQYVVLSMYT